ncbi:hypothetical protein ACFWYW_58000 [Nonomuraea sp. NPDC059023]|uniref:hypothetical protein n=1 Tax=unclassified Nonomuraea TaxID=2593643 RepID=UPI00367BABD0
MTRRTWMPAPTAGLQAGASRLVSLQFGLGGGLQPGGVEAQVGAGLFAVGFGAGLEVAAGDVVAVEGAVDVGVAVEGQHHGRVDGDRVGRVRVGEEVCGGLEHQRLAVAGALQVGGDLADAVLARASLGGAAGEAAFAGAVGVRRGGVVHDRLGRGGDDLAAVLDGELAGPVLGEGEPVGGDGDRDLDRALGPPVEHDVEAQPGGQRGGDQVAGALGDDTTVDGLVAIQTGLGQLTYPAEFQLLAGLAHQLGEGALAAAGKAHLALGHLGTDRTAVLDQVGVDVGPAAIVLLHADGAGVQFGDGAAVGAPVGGGGLGARHDCALAIRGGGGRGRRGRSRGGGFGRGGRVGDRDRAEHGERGERACGRQLAGGTHQSPLWV